MIRNRPPAARISDRMSIPETESGCNGAAGAGPRPGVAVTDGPDQTGEATPRQRRRLVAILHADVVGYSRHMGRDEEATHRRVSALYSDFEEICAGHGGRVVGTAGDAVLADFPSVVDALSAAVEIQRSAARRNDGVAPDDRFELRIGINLGDVIDDGGDLFGDGVNVAQRVQALADPGGIAVSGPVYDQVRNKLDLGFADRGAHRVKNIAEPVHVYSVTEAGARVRRRLPRVPLLAVLAFALLGAAVLAWSLDLAPFPQRAEREDALSGKPTVAVLPFEDRSPGAEPWFGDGITEDVIAQLGRFSSLTVLSWSAVAPYRDAAVTPEDLAEALDVRYVVSGSLLRDGQRLQIRVQLTDARRGILLWSDRLGASTDDVFALQDQVARQVAGALATRVTGIERARAFQKPTESLDAYDYVLRGRELLRTITRTSNFEARRMFEAAARFDADYAAATLGLGWTHLNDFLFGWSERPDRSLDLAQELAGKAVALERQNADAHALLANILRFRRQDDAARRHIDIALDINPNDAQSQAIRSRLLLDSGQVEAAVAPLELALRLDPNPQAAWLFTLGEAYYLLGRYADAVEVLERFRNSIEEDPTTLAILAAAQAQLGRTAAAAASAESLLKVSPFFDADSFAEYFAPPDDRAHLLEGLRKAGL